MSSRDAGRQARPAPCAIALAAALSVGIATLAAPGIATAQTAQTPATAAGRQATQEAGHDLAALRAMARAAAERRDWADALPRWQALEAAAPADIDLLIESARVHGFADRNADAAERYRRVLELAPSRRTDVLLSLAWQTLWAGQPALAEPLFLEVATHPAAFAGGDDGFDAWRGVAEARRNDGRLADALQAYEQAQALRPADRGVARARAQTLTWMDRYDEAATAYEQLLREDPDDRASRYGLARTRNFAGRHREAVAAYREGFARDRAAGLEVPSDVRLDHARALRWAGYDELAHAALEGLAQPEANWLREYRTGRELQRWADAGVEFATDRDRLDTRTTTVSAGWRPTAASTLELAARWVDLTEPTRAAQGERLGVTWRTRLGTGAEAIGTPADHGPAWAGVTVQANRFGDWHPVTGAARAHWLPTDTLRVDGELGRELAETPLALANRVTVDLASVGAHWRWQPRSSIAGAVAALKFDDGNQRTRVSLRADHQLHARPKLVVGVEAMAFRSSDPSSDTRPARGYWNPRSYREARAYLALGHEARPWDLTLKLGLGIAREEDGWGLRSSGHPNLWEVSAGHDLHRSVRVRAYAGGSGGSMGVASGGEGYWRRYIGIRLTGWF